MILFHGSDKRFTKFEVEKYNEEFKSSFSTKRYKTRKSNTFRPKMVWATKSYIGARTYGSYIYVLEVDKAYAGKMSTKIKWEMHQKWLKNAYIIPQDKIKILEIIDCTSYDGWCNSKADTNIYTKFAEYIKLNMMKDIIKNHVDPYGFNRAEMKKIKIGE